MKKKILLMYVSEDSGHHRASVAIEKAFKLKGEGIETLNVNSFNYTNPILEKIVTKAYMGLIRQRPEFWGYLYDNPNIVRKTQRLRESIHKYNTGRLRNLIDTFRPDAVICTQAFPCGMVADYKETYNSSVNLYGVLTDYAPHSYWIFDKVNAYFVPSGDTGNKLVHNGVHPSKVIETGIPLDPVFKKANDRAELINKLGYSGDKPIILLMGGSQGIGPMKEVYLSLLKTHHDIQIVAITGKNKGLFKWFRKQGKRADKEGKKLFTYSYVNNMDEIMETVTIVVSKPGGITTAEACTKGLPLLIIQPIPGQEQMNADYLIKHDVAIKIDQPTNVGVMVDELLYNRRKLEELHIKARNFANPESSQNIASYVLADIG